MRNAEQNEILGAFLSMLEVPTGDGGNKRAAGTKPLWKVDEGHYGAFVRHLSKWKAWPPERYDADSGAHHLVHVAWRALALAYQEMVEDGLIPESPPPVHAGSSWDDTPEASAYPVNAHPNFAGRRDG